NPVKRLLKSLVTGAPASATRPAQAGRNVDSGAYTTPFCSIIIILGSLPFVKYHFPLPAKSAAADAAAPDIKCRFSLTDNSLVEGLFALLDDALFLEVVLIQHLLEIRNLFAVQRHAAALHELARLAVGRRQAALDQQ